jgi:hypothetical protein
MMFFGGEPHLREAARKTHKTPNFLCHGGDGPVKHLKSE